jgi:hypothetical protein
MIATNCHSRSHSCTPSDAQGVSRQRLPRKGQKNKGNVWFWAVHNVWQKVAFSEIILGMRRYLGLGVFFYVLVCGIFVQFALLPHILPALNDGNGLIKSSDSEDFHRFAADQAAIIRQQGWSAWTLRPVGQSPAGIASAMYVLMGHSKPWAMLPVNAALWSLSAWILFLILRPLVSSDTRAALCALPFVIAPSALLFLTQIHKDPFVIAGTLVLWLALTRLLDGRNALTSWRESGRILAWMIGGLILLWVGRPYTMFLALLGFCVVGLGLLLADMTEKRFSRPAWAIIALSALICFGMGRTKDAQDYSGVGLETPEEMTNSTTAIDNPSCLGPLDLPFRRMALMRSIYFEAYPQAQSKLDENTELDSPWKVVAYVPRALQLLLLAPFPSSWIHRGASNLFSVLVYAETAMRYLLFPGLIWLCWQKRRVLAFWVPWLFFVPWGVIYVITTPNLGTLIRIRFSWVMMLAALGAVGTGRLWDAWRQGKKCE